MKNLIKVALVLALGSLAFVKQAKLTITSTAFSANSPIPSKYTCEGEEVSPPLKISGIPKDAKALAIILHDPDAPHADGFTHWVAWNLPVDGTIPENFKGGVQGLNGSNKPGYKGMCPPTGTHHYNFNVYALDSELKIPATIDKAGLEKAIQGHVLAAGTLTGLYKKNGQ